MDIKQIQESVEGYLDLLVKREKLQRRLSRCNGRDIDQEMIILHRLEPLERTIEFIEYAIFESDLLTDREACAIEHRIDGRSYKEIGEIFNRTYSSIRQTLKKSYKKIADLSQKQHIA